MDDIQNQFQMFPILASTNAGTCVGSSDFVSKRHYAGIQLQNLVINPEIIQFHMIWSDQVMDWCKWCGKCCFAAICTEYFRKWKHISLTFLNVKKYNIKTIVF